MTSKQTQSIWVNDYRLQLYRPGSAAWNYVASTELRTLKRGQNSYVVTARDGEGKILDHLTYTVEFRPVRQ